MHAAKLALRLLPVFAAAALGAGPVAAQDDQPRIFHTIRLEARDDADPAEVARVVAMMKQMGETIDVVEDYIVGADLSGEFDVSATFVVRGYDDFRTYLFDPLHIAVDMAGIPMAKNLELLDIVDTPNPQEAAARLAAIHQERFETVEGLAELIQQVGR